MVAIEHRSISSNTSSSSILSPTSNSSVNSATVSVTSTTSISSKSTTTLTVNKKMSTEPETSTSSKSAVSQRQVEPKVMKKSIKAKNGEATGSASGTSATVVNKEDTKKGLKLDLKGKDNDLESLKSPKSPIGGRLAHQNSLSSSVDLEDRKTLREALYQGIFHRHRRTIFAFGSFLRMLRSRNSQYNSIRSASEGETEAVEEVR